MMPYFSRIGRASKRQLMKSITVCWVTQDAEEGRLGKNSASGQNSRSLDAQCIIFTCNQTPDGLLIFLRDAPGFSQGFLFWGIGTWRCQRILAEAMSLPSCTNGNHHVTVTHHLPLPLGFCTQSSLHTMTDDQEQGHSWEP